MNSKLSHILFFTTISAFPPYGGEKIRSIELVKLLGLLAQKLTVVCPEAPVHPQEYGFNANTTFISIKSGKRGALQQKVFNKTKYSILEKKAKLAIEQIHRVQPVALAFIDYGFLGQYIAFLKAIGIKKVIYGTHNAQSHLEWQTPRKTILKKADALINYCLQQWHEKRFFNGADNLIVVSEEDKKFHSAFVDSKKIIVLPNFLDAENHEFSTFQKSFREQCIVMTANFYSFQNIEGAEWFLKEIWDRPLSDRFQLKLVGIGSKEFLEKFKLKYFNPPNCMALGEVENMRAFIVSSVCSVVPLLSGSGSRLKILEAMAWGTPLISTSKGAEGIVHEGSILIADTKEAFKAYLHETVKMNEKEYEALRHQARMIFYQKYSTQSCKDLIASLMLSNEVDLSTFLKCQ